VTAVGVSAPQIPVRFQTEHITADKQQTQFSAGTVISGWGSPDAVALRVLNSILTERLAVDLRETKGLAYSVGSELQLDQDYGWMEVRMGTRAESAELARQGILAVVKKLAGGDVTAEELERAINGIWGSTLRQRLPRIGQTFYRGWDEIRFTGFDTEDRLLGALRAVKLEDLQRLAKSCLDTEHWVMVSLGKQ
jgi:predicted Zn-dependent peptidase